MTTTTKTIRFKKLTPIYETLTIREEELPEYLCKDKRITCAQDVYLMFKHLLQVPRETFVCIHVDNKHKVLAIDYVSQGSMTASIVHPVSVFGPALLTGCVGIICLHQHPSGDPTPSSQDLELTTRLRQGAELLGLKLIDSIILGEDRYVSLADRGLL